MVTQSLSSLFQSLTTSLVKKCFLVWSLKLPWHNLRQFLLSYHFLLERRHQFPCCCNLPSNSYREQNKWNWYEAKEFFSKNNFSRSRYNQIQKYWQRVYRKGFNNVIKWWCTEIFSAFVCDSDNLSLVVCQLLRKVAVGTAILSEM